MFFFRVISFPIEFYLVLKDFHNLVPQPLVPPSLPLKSGETKSSQAIVYCYVHNSLIMMMMVKMMMMI